MLDKLRLVQWLGIALALLGVVWVIEPQIIEIIILKVAEIALFAYMGYWVDRSIFYYSRCTGGKDSSERAAQLRRAIIVSACVVGGCLAL